MSIYCGKTADLIEISFGMVDWVGPRSHVLDGIQVKFGVKWGGAVEPRVYRENVVSAVQKR